jgi:hypothetical protein
MVAWLILAFQRREKMSPYYYVMIAGIIVFAVLFVLHRKGKLH